MDSVGKAKRLAFIRQQLDSYTGESRQQGDRFFICCPYHAEKTPSASISQSGHLYCFGCKASAKYDEWAPKVGLVPYSKGKAKDEEVTPDLMLSRLKKVKKKIEQHSDDLEEEEFVREPMRNVKQLPRDEEWRGISTNLLRKVGARYAQFWKDATDEYEGYWTKTMLYLPCTIEGELVGYIKARLKKHETLPSYVNASGPWSKTSGMFPFDYAVKLAHKIADKYGTVPSVVAVEGQRDALRLLENKIPAVSILGTQSWTNEKAKLLNASGIERLILFMDGDDAGRIATENIAEQLAEQHYIEPRVLALWKMKGSPWADYKTEEQRAKAKKKGVEFWDPGCCPERIIKQIKRKYFRKEQ